MFTLNWDDPLSKVFQAGLDRGVLYFEDGTSAPWIGLLSVDIDDFSGAEAKSDYLDGIKYHERVTRGDLVGTITAFTSPPEFDRCNGMAEVYNGFSAMNQGHEKFALVYRTKVGDAQNGLSHYKLHLLYGLTAIPDVPTIKTIGSEIDPLELSWKITAVPVQIPDMAPSAHFVIDTRELYPGAIATIEALLYGADGDIPSIPKPSEVPDILENAAGLRVIDHGDGTWTATTEIDGVISVDESEESFVIDWPTANYIDETSYTLESY